MCTHARPCESVNSPRTQLTLIPPRYLIEQNKPLDKVFELTTNKRDTAPPAHAFALCKKSKLRTVVPALLQQSLSSRGNLVRMSGFHPEPTSSAFGSVRAT